MNIPQLAIGCALAGATTLTLFMTPFWRAPPSAARGASTTLWSWPEAALRAPTIVPNALDGFDIPSRPADARRIATLRYTAVTEVPKTPPPPSADEPPHAAKQRNVCEIEGGKRITFYRHHHEGWRCIYPHHRHRR